MPEATGRIKWDVDGEHYYETGVKNGVLFVANANGWDKGVAWNGLTGVTESPSGAEATAIYADNIKYLNLYSAEEFGGTIEAYMYPKEFEVCDGSADPETLEGMTFGQQERKSFAFCYRTEYGNDTLGDAYGHKIHIIYGCRATPSEKAYTTINDSPEAITFSWEITTVPTSLVPEGMKPTSVLTFDSKKLGDAKMKKLEDLLYGVDADETQSITAKDPEMKSPADLLTYLTAT